MAAHASNVKSHATAQKFTRSPNMKLFNDTSVTVA